MLIYVIVDQYEVIWGNVGCPFKLITVNERYWNWHIYEKSLIIILVRMGSSFDDDLSSFNSASLLYYSCVWNPEARQFEFWICSCNFEIPNVCLKCQKVSEYIVWKCIQYTNSWALLGVDYYHLTTFHLWPQITTRSVAVSWFKTYQSAPCYSFGAVTRLRVTSPGASFQNSKFYFWWYLGHRGVFCVKYVFMWSKGMYHRLANRAGQCL